MQAQEPFVSVATIVVVVVGPAIFLIREFRTGM
jgi:hypothetical protein